MLGRSAERKRQGVREKGKAREVRESRKTMTKDIKGKGKQKGRRERGIG